MNRWIRALLPLLLVVLLAACGGGSAVTPTPLALTQNYVSGDGTISFQYPPDWVATAVSGQVTIANSQAAFEARSPAPGQFLTRMIVGPIASVSGLSADSKPLDVVTFFVESLSSSAITFSAPVETPIGTRRAGRVDGTGADGQGVILALDMGDGNYSIISVTCSPGELSRFEGTLEAILQTLVYVPPKGS
jgi:hypothetical protein